MARIVGLVAAGLLLVLVAAAIVGHWRERAVYNQLAGYNEPTDLVEHRSASGRP